MAKEVNSNAVNLLCEGTLIVGDIKTKNDIRIDGILKGKIATSGRLVVGNTAKIEGDIECANIDVMGVILGNINASQAVSLKAPGKVTLRAKRKRFRYLRHLHVSVPQQVAGFFYLLPVDKIG